MFICISSLILITSMAPFDVTAVQAATASAAPPGQDDTGKHVLVEPGQIKWVDNPAVPKGAKRAFIMGNSKKPGVVNYLQKFPANYVIPPHTHSNDEAVTVLSGLSGDFHSGMGTTFSRRHSRLIKPGGYIVNPAGMPHYSWTQGGAMIEVASNGPLDIKYVNPKDDPRHKR